MKLRRVMEMLKGAGSRWFGHQRRALVGPVRRIRVHRTARGADLGNDALGVDPEVMGPDDGADLEGALADYLAPRHGEDDVLDFTMVNDRGEMVRMSEKWERRNNSMQVTRRESRAVVVSGLAVKPEQLACRCSKCGGYDAFAGICSRCGRAFCALHSRRMTTPHGVLTLCPTDYRREVALYDTWAAVDAQAGRTSGIPVMPERPFAANSEVPPRKGSQA